jgi:uncharacterized protein (TIGR03083 family)
MPNWPWSRRTAPEVPSTASTPQATNASPQVATAEPVSAPTTPEVATMENPQTLTAVVNPMDYSGKDTVLDVVRTERAGFYRIIDDPSNWEAPTRSGHWQVRDLVAHMIDVTEGYLTRWDMARRKEEASALGLLVMAQELDRVALTYRNLPREEVIARLKASSDRLLAIFDSLTAEQWGGFNVTHVFMGPLPMLFYPAFQIMDYGVHSWDMRWGLGDKEGKLDTRTAGVLVPFMFILMQVTVDQESAKGVDAQYGLIVDGDWGGKWQVTVKDGQFTYAPADDVSAERAIFHFRHPSDFVLTAFQRIEGGETSGDPQIIDQVRHLFFRI